MLSKGKIKFIRSLRLAKYRQKYQKIILEGTKLVAEALTEQPIAVQEVYATSSWLHEHNDLLLQQSIEVTETTPAELAQISSFKTPQEVLAVAVMPSMCGIEDMDFADWVIYLDGVRDPGNLGTIFRAADWFGFRHVCMSPDTADPYNPKVIQASMGSIFHVLLATGELSDLKTIAKAEVYITAVNGVPVFSERFSPGIVVFGNEGHGVKDATARLASKAISIPSDRSLGAESLNVGVAAGIICAALRYGR